MITKLNEEKKEQDVAKFSKIKAKVLTMARISLMLKNVKENKDLIKKAKLELGTNKLPPGLLGNNKEEAYKNVDVFVNKFKSDKGNEKFPLAAFKRR